MAVSSDQPHIPVLLEDILTHIAPVNGVWLDGTMGAGGYTRALLDAGASKVIAVDRDPDALSGAKEWCEEYGDRLVVVDGQFGYLDEIARNQNTLLDGVVLDIGVSSMQLDQATRGFSFMKDGPLDMRMAQSGPSASDIVNTAPEGVIADILFRFGEERASRKIARAIVMDRKVAPFTTTLQLAGMIERILPRPKPGRPHAATRSFQALRIAVNDELGELARGLQAAERVLREDGLLVVVSFHSLEDRMVKKFIQLKSDAPKVSRYAPAADDIDMPFEKVTRKAISASDKEIDANPRARSAKLRIARRTSADSKVIDPVSIGLPDIPLATEAWQ